MPFLIGRSRGQERLLRIAARVRDDQPESIVDHLKSEIDEHHADLPPEDDVTFVALKRDA